MDNLIPVPVEIPSEIVEYGGLQNCITHPVFWKNN
jgi:hypothetical protein